MVNSQSVIYVISANEAIAGNSSLARAQSTAIKQGLPLAVVYCAYTETADRLSSLIPLEAELAEFNLPLLVMIGREGAVLPAIKHHLKPVAIFKHDSTIKTGERLGVHPYTWPGTVISVAQLRSLLASNKRICR